MGQAISRIAVDHNCEITAPVDQGDDAAEKINDCDVVIDFLPSRCHPTYG